METIFNHKSFNYLVWTYRYIFAFKFTLSSQQPDIVRSICHRYRLHGWQICRRCRWYRSQIATGINNNGKTDGKICRRCCWYWWQICHRCHWYRWCTLNIANFRKHSKRSKWDALGIGGNLFMKKTRSKNSHDTVPLKHLARAQQQWRTQTLSPSIRWPSLEICHTHYEDREKSPGQATLFNIWTIWAMVRTSTVNLSMLCCAVILTVSVSVSLLDRVIKNISKSAFFYPWKDAAGGGNPRMVLVLLVQLCNEWYPVPVGCIHAPWHHKKSPWGN